MTFPKGPYHQKPSRIVVPTDIAITLPAPDLSDNIKRFFGKTGMWWGTWRSPQTRDGFETVLIIKNLGRDASADIMYIVPDYQPWYVTGGTYETQGRLSRKESGRVSLLFPFQPLGYTMECWAERQTLKGAVHMRFMSAYIELKQLMP